MIGHAKRERSRSLTSDFRVPTSHLSEHFFIFFESDFG